jgi:allantoicase
LEGVEGAVYTHVRVTIHPDGGIKRVRVFGRRANANEGEITSTDAPSTLDISSTKPLVNGIHPEKPALRSGKTIPALLLTPEAFAPYGNVVQAYNTPDAAPLGVKVTGANQGSATKYHALAPVKSCYPVDLGAKTALSVYRAKPIDANVGELFDVKLLERHPCTNQAFFALGAGTGVGEYALEKQGRAYLVVVALNGQGMSHWHWVV